MGGSRRDDPRRRVQGVPVKRRPPSCLATVAAAVCLAALVAVFALERDSFRAAVEEWALRDLRARAELAADALREPLATGDFRRLHAFGDECTANGVRLTVFSPPGGIVFDSLAATGSVGRADRPEVAEAFAHGEGACMRNSWSGMSECLYCARRSGNFAVRLAIPRERVLAPIRRGRTGLLLAALSGGVGVLLVFLSTRRLASRMAELSRERDAQAVLVERMRRIEKFRRDFIADVSHEIKTPLAGILGAADLLGDFDSLPADGRAALLQVLKDESKRLDNLVRGILSLSRIEHDQEGPPREFDENDVASIVAETMARLRPRAEAAGFSLATKRMDPCSIRCDAALVDEAVANLVENAIRHSGAHSATISVEARPGEVAISVEDHGVGIPEEERERVFERFHRGQASRASSADGSGLGLAIVRGIARLHGGEAVMLPVKPSGSRFEIRIPR